jgi:glycosyltransferase involved in cell wall biosynthesis
MINIHVYPSPLTHESRILRITDALAQAGIFDRIEVVGVARADLPAAEAVDAKRSLVRLPRKLFGRSEGSAAKLVRTLEWSVRVLSSLRGRKVACINAHSLAVLPLCVLAAKMSGARLVYDTHELETETVAAHGLRQRLARSVERMLIRSCDMVCVVSDSIADWYAREYGIARPAVVRNIPQYRVPRVGDCYEVRARMGLRPGRVGFIYQGGLMEGRGVERVLRVFACLPEVDLVCMGSGPLEATVRASAAAHRNIHFVPAVPPHEVLQYTRAADVGLCLTENRCLSYYFSLPNKMFECLHAGLPVIVTPLLDQQRLVESYGCGWVAPEDDQAFAELVRGIDSVQIRKMRAAVDRAASELNWDKERARLIQAYRDHDFA